MSLCGDLEADRIADRGIPLGSTEDEARVDFVMANLVRDGSYFTYEGPGKANLTDSQLQILGARLEKLRQEEHAAALTRPVDAEELTRRLEARTPSPAPSWTNEDEQRLTEIAREKLKQYGYPMPSEEELEHPSERMMMMEKYFELEDELPGPGGSLLRHLEHDWRRFRDFQPIDREIAAEVSASGGQSLRGRKTLEKMAEDYREFRKEYGYNEVEFTVSPDIAAQSRLTNWCEYQFRHMVDQMVLKRQLDRHDETIARAKAGQGWPWQAEAMFRESTLAVFESHKPVLEWIEERRQEMAGEKPRQAAHDNEMEVRRALPGLATVSIDASTKAADKSRRLAENREKFVAMMRAIGLFVPTDDSAPPGDLTPVGRDGIGAWANSERRAPKLPTTAINRTAVPQVVSRGCGVIGCLMEGCPGTRCMRLGCGEEGCRMYNCRGGHDGCGQGRCRIIGCLGHGREDDNYALRRSKRVASREQKLPKTLSHIQKPARKARSIQKPTSDRKLKLVREKTAVANSGSVEIMDSIETPEPAIILKSVKKPSEPTGNATKASHTNRKTSKSTSKPRSKKAEVKAKLPGKTEAATVARPQERKVVGRRGPKLETANAVASTRKGRNIKKPVRYGLDQ